MWQSDEYMVADEVVPDGAQCRSRVTFPSTTLEGSSKLSEEQYKQNTDSGFLSGVSISEDSGAIESSTNLTSDQEEEELSMKLKCAAQISDSVSQNPLYNKLSQCEPQKKTPRRITIHDLLRQDEDGDTPLHLAVLQGFIEVVFSLVRILPDPRMLELPNKKLQTPLHLAVLTNQPPLVRRLVVGGASVLLRDRNGNTPLHLACRDGHLECVRTLLWPVSQEERNCALLSSNAIPQQLPQDLETRNYEGQMPLHLAAINGHAHIVMLLCGIGANVNASEAKYGRTPLHYSVERRNPILMQMLVSQCGAYTEAETYAGYTAYQLAIAAAPRLAVSLRELGAHTRPSPIDKVSSSEDDDSSSDEWRKESSWRPHKDQNLAIMNEVLHLAA